MFDGLIALLMSLPLSLALSVAAHAQTPVAGQTIQAQSLQEEMRQIRLLMEQMRQLIERREARIGRLEKDEQPLTMREKIFLDRIEKMEKRLAEVESLLADMTSVDKCQRAGALTASALQTAAPPASNTTAAAPISDVGENSQAPAKPGGVGISPRFTANSIPRWKNQKEPFAFADLTWLTGAFRTKVEAPSQSGNKEAEKEAKKFRVDKTYWAYDVDNAGQSKKTGQSDKTNKGKAPASAGQGPPRRANPAPLDGVFPSSEYIGPSPLIGVPDTDPVYPLTEVMWRLSSALKESRIKVYGWVNPGIRVITSDESNIQESYAIVRNKTQQDKEIL